MSDDKFVKGLYVTRREQAPDFVVCSLSFKDDQFAEYMAFHVNEKGYVNIDILKSREGKIYAKLNDFKPEKKEG